MKMTKLVISIIGLFVITGCGDKAPDYCQGYIEGEFVYISSPVGGKLVNLTVSKGDEVKAGQQLFALETEPQNYDAAQADAALDQSSSLLADKRKGERPHQIKSREAQVSQAAAAAEIARLDEERLAPIHASQYISDNEYDQARLDYRQKEEALRQTREDLAQARLGDRDDQIVAAKAGVREAKAVLEEARWNLSQKTRFAPSNSLVFDTLYREGEWVGAGNPVVALLPPANIKVRFFVPQPLLSTVKRGEKIVYRIQGNDVDRKAVINYISPEVEYTPPVIFSQDNSSKLIFMVEALPTGGAEGLNPGQPVEVYLAASKLQ